MHTFLNCDTANSDLLSVAIRNSVQTDEIVFFIVISKTNKIRNESCAHFISFFIRKKAQRFVYLHTSSGKNIKKIISRESMSSRQELQKHNE